MSFCPVSTRRPHSPGCSTASPTAGARSWSTTVRPTVRPNSPAPSARLSSRRDGGGSARPVMPDCLPLRPSSSASATATARWIRRCWPVSCGGSRTVNAICCSVAAAPRAGAPGRRTPARAIWRWPGCCAAVPACVCTTSARLRAARRSELLALDLTDRRSGYPLQMVIGPRTPAFGSPRATSPTGAHRQVEGHRHLARDLAGGYATCGRPAGAAARTARPAGSHARRQGPPGERETGGSRSTSASGGSRRVSVSGPTEVLVIAKEPVAGRVKTRLCPPFTPAEAAELAAAALADTLEAVLALPARRRVLVLDGRPGPWVPPGFDVVPQSAGGLDERLAAAFGGCTGRPSWSAWTPRRSRPRCWPCSRAGRLGEHRGMVRPGRGRWLLGPRPG